MSSLSDLLLSVQIEPQLCIAPQTTYYGKINIPCYLFVSHQVSRQTQDYNQLLRLVALKGAIYNTNMGHVKWHSHRCKSNDQVELTLKNSKPQISPRMRGKNRSFEGLLLWGHRPKSYNWVLGLSREHEQSKSEEEHLLE